MRESTLFRGKIYITYSLFSLITFFERNAYNEKYLDSMKAEATDLDMLCIFFVLFDENEVFSQLKSMYHF